MRTPEGTIKDPAANPEPTKQPEPAKANEPAKDPTKEPAKPASGPPEKYDFKAPEGYEIDAKVLDEATPVFKELGLNQEQAQKLFDIYSKHSIESADAAFKQYEDTRKGWREEVTKSDLGDGKEALKPEVRANIDKAISSIGDAKAITEFKSAMDLTGVGDNPAFVRAMNSLGKLLSEGTSVKGGGPSAEGQRAPGSGPRSVASAMYPNLPTSSQR